MVAYVVNEITVTDAEAYAEYAALAKPTVEAHGGRYLARGGRTEAMIGEAPAGRVVILEFRSLEAAQAWRVSPEYQAAYSIRERASTSRVYVVEGV